MFIKKMQVLMSWWPGLCLWIFAGGKEEKSKHTFEIRGHWRVRQKVSYMIPPLRYFGLFLDSFTSLYLCKECMVFRKPLICLFGLDTTTATHEARLTSFLSVQECLLLLPSEFPLLVSHCQFWSAREIQSHNFLTYPAKLMEVFLQRDQGK